MYRPLLPARIVDSRSSLGLSKLSAKVSKSFTVCGKGGVAANAMGVTGNLTVTGQTAAGYLYLSPTQDNAPATSTLNFPLGDVRANGVSSYLPGSSLWVYYGASAGNTTDVVFDVTGWYAP